MPGGGAGEGRAEGLREHRRDVLALQPADHGLALHLQAAAEHGLHVRSLDLSLRHDDGLVVLLLLLDGLVVEVIVAVLRRGGRFGLVRVRHRARYEVECGEQWGAIFLLSQATFKKLDGVSPLRYRGANI